MVRGARPVATRTCSATTLPPSFRSRTALLSVRCADSTSTPWRMVTPASASPSATASHANGSCPVSSVSPRTIMVTFVPKLAYAVASSQATTPPPRMARLSGAAVALVASWLVHGSISARPGMSGSRETLPVLIVTACLARRSTVVPSEDSTVMARSPVNRACPRTRSISAEATQSACEVSSQSWTIEVRRANAAAGSTSPVTACAAPPTARAARRALPARSRAFDGMQAQYEHSPPTSSASTSATFRPPFVA